MFFWVVADGQLSLYRSGTGALVFIARRRSQEDYGCGQVAAYVSFSLCNIFPCFVGFGEGKKSERWLQRSTRFQMDIINTLVAAPALRSRGIDFSSVAAREEDILLELWTNRGENVPSIANRALRGKEGKNTSIHSSLTKPTERGTTVKVSGLPRPKSLRAPRSGLHMQEHSVRNIRPESTRLAPRPVQAASSQLKSRKALMGSDLEVGKVPKTCT